MTTRTAPWRVRTPCSPRSDIAFDGAVPEIDVAEPIEGLTPFQGTHHRTIGAEHGACLTGPRGVAAFPNPACDTTQWSASSSRHGSQVSTCSGDSPGSPMTPVSPGLGSPRLTASIMKARTPATSFIGMPSPKRLSSSVKPDVVNSPVLLAVTHGHCIEIFDPLVGTSAAASQRIIGTHGTAAGEFDEPRGIIALTKDPRRVLLVVVDTRNHRVQTVLAHTGATVQCIGRCGRGPKEFMFPHDVAELPNGNVVVADCMNHRVQVVDPTTGLFVGRFGSEGSDPGQLRRPKGIAVLSDGMVAVADHGNNRVQVFNPETGAVVRCVGSNPHGAISPKHLLCPNGLAVLPDGRLLVCEEAIHRLNVLDLRADMDPFVTTIGRPGTEDLHFNFPFGVATMPNGQVVIADSGNNRLQFLR